MRIVLLGATGFVGSHLLPELARCGHECIVLCRHPDRSRQLLLNPRVSLRYWPGVDAGELGAAADGADALINLVGILNEQGRDGSGFAKVHVGIVEHALAACRASGVRRLVHVSALNAGQGSSHYLASKGKAEALIRQAPDVDATIVRPSVIFGDGDAFFNRFAALLKLTPILPLACPAARMQPVWVGDVARAIAVILQRPETIGQTLDLVGPKVYTLYELVSWTARITGRRRWIVGLSDALSRLQGWVMDFVPGKPFSSDNYRSLQLDSVSQDNALPRLGISPHTLANIVPAYLGRSAHQRRLDQWRQRVNPQ